jgi:intein-encoded DNA endonuclease-like protein
MQRINLEKRIEAYNLLQILKTESLSRQEIVNSISKNFGVTKATAYGWFNNKQSPFSCIGKIEFKTEIFYVLGALLGDGCHYHWKGNFQVWLFGEKEFAKKFASKLSQCIGKNVKYYFRKNGNVWFVKVGNAQLYFLFKEMRKNFENLIQLIHNKNIKINSLEFIEGFFDAEGCVKIIKEEVRITPKICLDICNTDFRILCLIQKLLKDNLNIDARFSVQESKSSWHSSNKKDQYHLRIYKKDFVRHFFKNIDTIKLGPAKQKYVDNWLNN